MLQGDNRYQLGYNTQPHYIGNQHPQYMNNPQPQHMGNPQPQYMNSQQPQYMGNPRPQSMGNYQSQYMGNPNPNFAYPTNTPIYTQPQFQNVSKPQIYPINPEPLMHKIAQKDTKIDDENGSILEPNNNNLMHLGYYNGYSETDKESQWNRQSDAASSQAMNYLINRKNTSGLYTNSEYTHSNK